MPVCKNRFEKSARIFSRRHKQTTFLDAVFLGALRVKVFGYLRQTRFTYFGCPVLSLVYYVYQSLITSPYKQKMLDSDMDHPSQKHIYIILTPLSPTFI